MHSVLSEEEKWELNRTVSTPQKSLGVSPYALLSLVISVLISFTFESTPTAGEKVAYGPTGKGCTGSRRQHSLEMLTHNVGRHEIHPKPVYSSVCMQARLSLHLPVSKVLNGISVGEQ